MIDSRQPRATATVLAVPGEGEGLEEARDWAVQWALPLEVADAVMTMLSREITQRALLDEPIPADLHAALLPLRDAIARGYDQTEGPADTAAETGTFGDPHASVDCPHRTDTSLLLTAPLVMIGDLQDAVTVLLPGAHDTMTALDLALNALHCDDEDGDLLAAGPDLTATISDPGWLLLHPCNTPGHVLHLLAPTAGREADAILLTRIDFTRS